MLSSCVCFLASSLQCHLHGVAPSQEHPSECNRLAFAGRDVDEVITSQGHTYTSSPHLLSSYRDTVLTAVCLSEAQ